jgi:peptidoglycan hydrolase CwlO-like protein
MGQEQETNDLMKIRDDLTQERDRLLNDVTQLRRELDESSFKQNDLEKQIQESNEQILGLQEKITQAKTENMREAKKRVRCFFLNLIIKFIFFLFRNKLNLNLNQVNKF